MTLSKGNVPSRLALLGASSGQAQSRRTNEHLFINNGSSVGSQEQPLLPPTTLVQAALLTVRRTLAFTLDVDDLFGPQEEQDNTDADASIQS